MSSGSEKFPGNKARNLGNSARIYAHRRTTPGAFRRPFGNQTIARDEFFGASGPPPTVCITAACGATHIAGVTCA